jgi:hypothetical protein
MLDLFEAHVRYICYGNILLMLLFFHMFLPSAVEHVNWNFFVMSIMLWIVSRKVMLVEAGRIFLNVQSRVLENVGYMEDYNAMLYTGVYSSPLGCSL